MEATCFASLLCDDALLAHDDPAVLVRVRVSDGGLARGARLVLAEDSRHGKQRRRLEEWRERAVAAEAEAEELRRELQTLQS